MHAITKKKVLFIITQLELGGAQRWVFDTATHLNTNLYTATVAGGEIHESQELLNRLRARGIATHPLRHLVRAINPIQDFLASVELYCLIKKERPDILQLCSTKSGILGSIAGKLAGQKNIIYRIGGWAFNDPRPQWQNWIFLQLEKITAPLKTKIIVNSRKGYNEALQHRICHKEKLALIYNGINITPYECQREQSKSGKIVLGTIANFYKTKGLIYLLQAAQMLKNEPITFRIIGEGPERPALERYITQEKLKNVELLGALPNPEIYLKQFDILVIPSVKEGLPYVLLEAMAAGCPIISTTVGGIPEIIQHRKNGIVIPPRNPPALARELIALERNPKLRARLARAAQKTIQRHTLKEMMTAIQAMYYASTKVTLP